MSKRLGIVLVKKNLYFPTFDLFSPNFKQEFIVLIIVTNGIITTMLTFKNVCYKTNDPVFCEVPQISTQLFNANHPTDPSQ